MNAIADRYALTTGQAELLEMFEAAEEPTALYDLAEDQQTWRRAAQATALVNKGLLHREKGRCSKGVICYLYHVDPVVTSNPIRG